MILFPFDVIVCDLYQLPSQFNNLTSIKYILLFKDNFSKYIYGYCLNSKDDGEVVSKFIDFLKFVNPKIILSDNGGEFSNSSLSSLLTERGILKNFGPVRNLETQGLVERSNLDLGKFLFKQFLLYLTMKLKESKILTIILR